MHNKTSMTFNVVMGVLGIAVLIPAFVLLMHFAFLGNVASKSEPGGMPLAIWLAIGTLLGGIGYLVALGVSIWRPQADCRWCFYWLVGYAVYVAAMIGYVSSADFAGQVKTTGFMSALFSNLQELLYILIPVILVVLLIVRSRLERSDVP